MINVSILAKQRERIRGSGGREGRKEAGEGREGGRGSVEGCT